MNDPNHENRVIPQVRARCRPCRIHTEASNTRFARPVPRPWISFVRCGRVAQKGTRVTDRRSWVGTKIDYRVRRIAAERRCSTSRVMAYSEPSFRRSNPRRKYVPNEETPRRLEKIEIERERAAEGPGLSVKAPRNTRHTVAQVIVIGALTRRRVQHIESGKGPY